MKPILDLGHTHIFRYTVPREKTVPYLYAESADFRAMPEVFATGFMVGLMEWACLDHLKRSLEPGEGSLGIMIDVNHVAPTLPGMTVMVTVTVAGIEGRRIYWDVIARDDIDVIGQGRHGRMIVSWDKFNAKLAEKSAAFQALPKRPPTTPA